MKLCLAVLIAAVTVNCLVTAINATTATDTLKLPYTDMLLPPLEDVQASSNDEAKISLNIKKTAVSTTTSTSNTTKITTTMKTTTEKPITNDVNNILPELPIEALLPPLYEAKIDMVKEKKDKKKGNVNKQETTKENKIDTTTTTQKPTTTTTTRTTTRIPQTAKPTTTIKPSTTTTTLKPLKVEVPSLFLDALLPPIFDNDVDNKDNTRNVLKSSTTTRTTTTKTTTQKPFTTATASFKTTKKSYYQQQTQHLKELHLIDKDDTHPKNYVKQQQQLKDLQQTTNAETKNYNKQNQQLQKIQNSSKANNSKQVSKSQSQHVVLPSQQHFHRNIKKLTLQHVAEQKKLSNNDFNNYNYSFDFYLSTTTPRPPKSGLPTITPFPHRLGR